MTLNYTAAPVCWCTPKQVRMS